MSLKGITTDGSQLYPAPIGQVFGAVCQQPIAARGQFFGLGIG
ncbi:MAG: hypothetical protein ACE15C_20520 [Phycisphaerae bacterium]